MKQGLLFLLATIFSAMAWASGPKITVIGGNTIMVDVFNQDYKDAGATAVDSTGLDISSSIVKNDTVDINKIGTYIIAYTVTDTYGKKDSAFRTVKVVDRMAPSIICLGRVLQKGSVFNPLDGLSVSDNYYAPISFFNGIDGCKIEIDSSTLNLKAPGNYEICYKVTDGSGNTTSHCCTIVVTEVLGINALPAHAVFSLYPNPSQGWVTVSLKNTDMKQIQVSDALGRNILTTQVSPGQGQLTLDLNNCAAGVYFITVSASSGIYSQRISIEK